MNTLSNYHIGFMTTLSMAIPPLTRFVGVVLYPVLCWWPYTLMSAPGRTIVGFVLKKTQPITIPRGRLGGPTPPDPSSGRETLTLPTRSISRSPIVTRPAPPDLPVRATSHISCRVPSGGRERDHRSALISYTCCIRRANHLAPIPPCRVSGAGPCHAHLHIPQMAMESRGGTPTPGTGAGI